jgi:ribosomal protein L11
LISFTTKYIAHIAYAFISNAYSKADDEKHKQPIFGCMTKKEVKSIAEKYMNDITYNDWFGARLKVV